MARKKRPVYVDGTDKRYQLLRDPKSGSVICFDRKHNKLTDIGRCVTLEITGTTDDAVTVRMDRDLCSLDPSLRDELAQRLPTGGTTWSYERAPIPPAELAQFRAWQQAQAKDATPQADQAGLDGFDLEEDPE